MTSALSTGVGCEVRELLTKSYEGMLAGCPSLRSCSVATISPHANACAWHNLLIGYPSISALCNIVMRQLQQIVEIMQICRLMQWPSPNEQGGRLTAGWSKLKPPMLACSSGVRLR